MPSTIAGTLQSTQETDPAEYRKQTDLLRQRAKTAQKQFGNVGGPYIEPEVDLGTSLGAKQVYQQGEFDRRKQAAQNKYDLANQIDTRRSGFSDQVRKALFERENLAKDTAQKEQQINQKNQLAVANANQNFRTKLSELNFNSYKNAAERMDTMMTAYDKGILEFELLDAAKANQLALADIDRYFAILQNDWDNKLKDLKMMSDFELEQLKRDFEQKSSNIGAIISGLTKLGSQAWASSNYSKTAIQDWGG